MWRIEYRVCSAVCTMWWSFWVILRPGTSAVQLSPVQKKTVIFEPLKTDGWADGNQKNGFPKGILDRNTQNTISKNTSKNTKTREESLRLNTANSLKLKEEISSVLMIPQLADLTLQTAAISDE